MSHNHLSLLKNSLRVEKRLRRSVRLVILILDEADNRLGLWVGCAWLSPQRVLVNLQELQESRCLRQRQLEAHTRNMSQEKTALLQLDLKFPDLCMHRPFL